MRRSLVTLREMIDRSFSAKLAESSSAKFPSGHRCAFFSSETYNHTQLHYDVSQKLLSSSASFSAGDNCKMPAENVFLPPPYLTTTTDRQSNFDTEICCVFDLKSGAREGRPRYGIMIMNGSNLAHSVYSGQGTLC